MTLSNAIRYRDALMLAILTSRPIRSRNMLSIELGKHLIRLDRTWRLEFEAREVKNRQALSFDLPASLTSHMDRYVSQVRPMFPEANASTKLWISKDGTILGRQFLYWRIKKITKRLLGQSINPHFLRDCAATTLTTEKPELAPSARPLLGHRYASTTERYYVQADQISASRRVNDVLDNLIDATETSGIAKRRAAR
jgi:site-specific recombinase XerD